MFHRFFSYSRLLIWLFVASLVFFSGLGKITPSHFILFHAPLMAQSMSPRQWVQEGIDAYQVGNYQEAVKIWKKALSASSEPQEKQIILENLATAYQKLNQNEQVFETLEKLEKYAIETGNKGKLSQLLTQKAQIYLNIGQPQTAIALLCASTDEKTCQPNTALAISRQIEDTSIERSALGILAEAYRFSGKYDQSIQTLETALSLPSTEAQTSLKQSLGNSYTARGQLSQLRAKSAEKQDHNRSNTFQKQAISDYQQATKNFRANLNGSEDPLTKLENLLNLIRLSYYSQNFQIISPQQRQNDLQQALILLPMVPQNVTTVYASIDLASLPAFSLALSTPLIQCPTQWQLSDFQRLSILDNALTIAKNLNNPRVESFALGAIGHFYECLGRTKEALTLTQKAILVANQDLNTKDGLYLLEWQKGRIFQAKGQFNLAVNAYQNAYNTLENIRSDLLTTEKDVQLDFRDSIEPIYRQLAQLKLQLADSQSLSSIQQKQELKEVLKIIDHLRLAELQNHLGNDCFLRIDAPVSQPISAFPQTAIINSLMFQEKTAIIIILPGQSIKIHWIKQNKANIIENIAQFRQSILDGFLTLGDYDTSLSETLYSQIIRPFETDLQEYDVKNLVFIQDSPFRPIPMAALHDGKQFLIEKYAVSTTPSLSLTFLQKRTLSDNKTLILGVTEESQIDGQIFPSLDNIPLEIATISQQFPNHQLLVNQQFNPQTLTQTLDNADYSIIHIATHAQFGTIPDDTFLVAGNNDKIAIKSLENTLRLLESGSNSVELLTLTACETAEGDERSALGLAAVAIQAGVQSAIASLWPVSDQSTLQLILAFYDNLINSGVNKAEALREAQIQLIQAQSNPDINNQYSHPVYWSSFILIGNWL
ncbi:TPR repeat like (modular protein) [Microcystis aeruginosa PCC 9809]|uniref:TPR repeat like (Modular protein) n=1 Tax=Microcystis aeruginosa PCC 9809 TaxID=1160285 RepID=I4HIA5_MICAE|nr:CHAT domain-containing protein [Microcystis aeruginosa]CCI21779.1 TPR repeat like (modular protein) [Microcystis aeruginosa PCC 9809]